MSIDKIVAEAFAQRRTKGDKPEELLEIRTYLQSAERIIIPNKNGIKVNVINRILKKYGIPEAESLQIDTYSADNSRIPALAKAYMALDQCECDVVIARGRLGVPGSGSMLVVIDAKGRILTAALSPSHIVHQLSLEEAVEKEMTDALGRIGFHGFEDRDSLCRGGRDVSD